MEHTDLLPQWAVNLAQGLTAFGYLAVMMVFVAGLRRLGCWPPPWHVLPVAALFVFSGASTNTLDAISSRYHGLAVLVRLPIVLLMVCSAWSAISHAARSQAGTNAGLGVRS